VAKRSNVPSKRSIISQVKPPTGVWLQSNYPGTLKVIGKITQKQYVFPANGNVVEVDRADVQGLMVKVFNGNSCCGGSVKPLPYFKIVNK